MFLQVSEPPQAMLDFGNDLRLTIKLFNSKSPSENMLSRKKQL